MNIYAVLIIIFILSVYLTKTLADILNVQNISNKIPRAFSGFYNKEKYAKAQSYLKARTKFSLVLSTFMLAVTIIFILIGGFNFVDDIAVSFGFGDIATGLIFAGIILFAAEILQIPFSAYSVFAIEEKFGFNRMKVKTFIADLVKGWIVGAIIGAALFSAVLWLFTNVEKYAWVYAFAAVVVFEVLITFIYPAVIMPLFNKFTPLEKGRLRLSIERYAKRENFKMKGLFKMDNSKRSTKSNAFFAGFGRFRRIVLFDTLIKNHTVDELVSVLAHEMGHFKLGHIKKSMLLSFVVTGVMFFIFSLVINQPWFYDAFLMNNQPVYAGIIFFTFWYSPLSLLLGIFLSSMSRKHEYAADAYAVSTYKKPRAMTSALKKLSVDNLSNLYPHKFKVFLEYSHPPTLERIEAIKKIKIK